MGSDAMNPASVAAIKSRALAALLADAPLGATPSSAGLNLGSPKNSRGKKDDFAALDVGGGLSVAGGSNSSQMVAAAQDPVGPPAAPRCWRCLVLKARRSGACCSDSCKARDDALRRTARWSAAKGIQNLRDANAPGSGGRRGTKGAREWSGRKATAREPSMSRGLLATAYSCASALASGRKSSC